MGKLNDPISFRSTLRLGQHLDLRSERDVWENHKKKLRQLTLYFHIYIYIYYDMLIICHADLYQIHIQTSPRLQNAPSPYLDPCEIDRSD